ncbi:7545_t:CDS:2, partial [Scutellospora calospora]
NFKIQKRLFSLNASFMKEKNGWVIDKKPTNSSAEAHGSFTSVRSENLIVMDLPMVQKIYDEHIQKLEAKNKENKAEIKKIYDEYIQKLEEHKDEIVKLTNKQNDEYIQKLEEKNKEHKDEVVKLTNKQNDEYIQKLEEKNKEHKDEVVKLTNKQNEDRIDFILKSEEVFKLRRVCNVRAALEYIRSWISRKKGHDPLIYEPVDKVLEKLNNDQRFKEYLINTCEMNNVNVEAVNKCIGGLYHKSSKELHGHDKIVIHEKDWVINEIIALGLIFKYFAVPFDYMNERDEFVKFPYKNSHMRPRGPT